MGTSYPGARDLPFTTALISVIPIHDSKIFRALITDSYCLNNLGL